MINLRASLAVSALLLTAATSAKAQLSWDEKSEMKIEGAFSTHRASATKVAIQGGKKSVENTAPGTSTIEITDFEKGVIDTLYPPEKVYSERPLFHDPSDLASTESAGAKDPANPVRFEVSAKFTGKTSNLGSMKCREIVRTMKSSLGDKVGAGPLVQMTTSACQPAPAEYLSYKALESESFKKYAEKLKEAGVSPPGIVQAQLLSNSPALDHFLKLSGNQKQIRVNVPADVAEWLAKGFESQIKADLTMPAPMKVTTTRFNLSAQSTGTATFDVPADYRKVERHSSPLVPRPPGH